MDRLMLETSKLKSPSNVAFATTEELRRLQAAFPEADQSPLFWDKLPGAGGIYFRPGTMVCADQLRRGFTDVRSYYATPREAEKVLNSIPDAKDFYSYSQNGDLWSIATTTPPTFDVPRNQEWRLLLHGRGTNVPFGFDELIEALIALPLLNGEFCESEIRSQIKDNEPQERLVDELLRSGAVGPATCEPAAVVPRLQFLGHSSLFVQAKQAAIVIDPAIHSSPGGELDPTAFIRAAHADAIFITHHHWDHCNPSTLVRIPRDKQIYVPRCRNPSFANPPLVKYLALLGFHAVIEVDPWQTVQIGDIEVTTVPCHGEPFGLGSLFDAFTYLIQANGQTIYSSVDACHDEAGTMEPIIAEVARRTHVDVFFFGSSGFRFARAAHAGYPWRFSNDLITRPELSRMHPTTDDALRWARVLRPRYSVPFAEFLWDGTEAESVTLPVGATRDVSQLYAEHWNQRKQAKRCRQLEGDTGLSRWKRGLDRLHASGVMNILMLHPMQSIVYTC